MTLFEIREWLVTRGGWNNSLDTDAKAVSGWLKSGCTVVFRSKETPSGKMKTLYPKSKDQ